MLEDGRATWNCERTNVLIKQSEQRNEFKCHFKPRCVLLVNSTFFLLNFTNKKKKKKGGFKKSSRDQQPNKKLYNCVSAFAAKSMGERYTILSAHKTYRHLEKYCYQQSKYGFIFDAKLPSEYVSCIDPYP